MNVHPVADLFPMLTPEELADLAADIKAHGLLNDIVVDKDGTLLDGRNRLAACELAGVEPRFTTYEGDDPAGYALAVNIARRHLNKGQQAMIVAKARLETNQSTRDVAATSGVSQTRVVQAAVVLKYAPVLADAVIAGALSLDKAYDEARERKADDDDAEEQLAALRAEYPDLADQVVEETLSLAEARAAAKTRTAEYKARIQDQSSRLNRLVVGWYTLELLQNNPHREAVLATFTDADRARLECMEAVYLEMRGDQ